jgi:hypothetical protein
MKLKRNKLLYLSLANFFRGCIFSRVRPF